MTTEIHGLFEKTYDIDIPTSVHGYSGAPIVAVRSPNLRPTKDPRRCVARKIDIVSDASSDKYVPSKIDVVAVVHGNAKAFIPKITTKIL